MKTRLALVACKDAAQGPWIRSRENEKAVRITGLGKGERIISRLEYAESQETIATLDSEGTFPLPDLWNRICFEKQCVGDATHHTHVELLTT